jgi:hypothetical protein
MGVINWEIRGVAVFWRFQPGLFFAIWCLNWNDPAEKVHADFHLHRPGTFEVSATYSSNRDAAGSRFVISIGDQRLSGVTKATGDVGKYKTVSLGRITLPRKDRYTLWITPATEGPWKGMGPQSVTLRPATK